MRTLALASAGVGLLLLWRGNASDRAARSRGEAGTRAVPLVSPAGAALAAGGGTLAATGRPLWTAGAALAAWLLADATNTRENARLLAEPGEWYDAEGNVVP